MSATSGSDAAYHPELRSIARFLPRGAGTPRVVRASRVLQRFAARPRPGVGVVPVGEVSVRVHRPPDHAPRSPGPAVLHLHGGGYIMGFAAMEDAWCRSVAARLGVVVASVEYRLAPEHPHPTPVRDAHDALVWLAGLVEVDPDRIAIAGGSAGAGLGASLALLARERGEVTPAFQLLFYPMLDDRTVTRTQPDEDAFRVWNSASNRYGWSCYLGTEPGGPDVDPIAAAARHTDLSGLPPAWIGVGTLDLFHDEDVAYAERLRAAGVHCELEVVDGAFHGFNSIARRAPVSRAFDDSAVAAMARALGVAERSPSR